MQQCIARERKYSEGDRNKFKILKISPIFTQIPLFNSCTSYRKQLQFVTLEQKYK
jgi:hypothetical protein